MIFCYFVQLETRMTNVSTTDAEEDYEYDISESLDQYDWAELIPAVVVYAIVFILGICGNGIVQNQIKRILIKMLSCIKICQ